MADEARGFNIQAGFKVCCQLLLQLNPNFNTKALEALITLRVMDSAIVEVEEEVAVRREDAIDREEAEDDKEVTRKVVLERAFNAGVMGVEVVEVLEEEEATA